MTLKHLYEDRKKDDDNLHYKVVHVYYCIMIVLTKAICNTASHGDIKIGHFNLESIGMNGLF